MSALCYNQIETYVIDQQYRTIAYNYLTPIKENLLEIDVKPKQKLFITPEDKQKFIESYRKKLKTELCKNFMLTGYCKFENQCSFAHGEHELTQKTHLHEKFKTRPCQKYFQEGFCNYGIRCQYLHEEIKEKEEYWPVLGKIYRQNKMKLPINPQKLKKEERIDIQRFQALQKKFNLEKVELYINFTSPRLPFMKSKFPENKDESFLTLSTQSSSRKNSDEQRVDLRI